jgi:hypothetical protein
MSKLSDLLYVECSFPPWIYDVLIHFSHDRTSLSIPSSSSTTFQNYQGIFDLLIEVSKFQHLTKLCSKCISLVSSLNLSPIGWCRYFLCGMLHFPWKYPDSFLSAFICIYFTENRGRVCGTSAYYSEDLGSNHGAVISPSPSDKFL